MTSYEEMFCHEKSGMDSTNDDRKSSKLFFSLSEAKCKSSVLGSQRFSISVNRYNNKCFNFNLKLISINIEVINCQGYFQRQF